MVKKQVVGESLPRPDALAKVQGRARYIKDMLKSRKEVMSEMQPACRELQQLSLLKICQGSMDMAWQH